MNEIVNAIRSNNWAAIIQERQNSGQTIRQWCADNNISEGAYYYRLHKLREQMINAAAAQAASGPESQDSSPEFVRVPDAVVSAPAGGTALRVRRGTTVIEVRNDASEGILSLMREVLLQC